MILEYLNSLNPDADIHNWLDLFYPTYGLLAAAGLFMLAAVADTITTLDALDRGLGEGNDIYRRMLTGLGKRGASIAKMAISVISILILWGASNVWPEYENWYELTLLGMAIVTGFIAWRNTRL